ncbi:MAG TPA: nucleotidyltransferase family protein [Magnetospirillum sp.]|nr:nucleotidyltransferase family protein [Magnetospirillum sp.]
MTTRPRHAMVLAAGLGLRMRPITEHTPKPLVEVAGRTMLDRALDHLAAAGVTELVVNTHWLAHRVAAHLSGRPGITLSHEDVLLETGGGVAHALPHLGDQPFYVVNSDIIWTDGAIPALKRLAAAWDDGRMDALLLLQRTATAMGYEGNGDFFLDAEGVPRRRRDREVAPLLFSGVQILSPRLFRDAPQGKFSLNVLYDRALEEGRLSAIVHDGRWYHVGTPDALPEVETALEAADA